MQQSNVGMQMFPHASNMSDMRGQSVMGGGPMYGGRQGGMDYSGSGSGHGLMHQGEGMSRGFMSPQMVPMAGMGEFSQDGRGMGGMGVGGFGSAQVGPIV